MIIQQGYNGKLTSIRVTARDKDDERRAELWINQEGVERWLLGATLKPVKKGKSYPDYTVVQDEKGNRFVRGEAITKIEGQETLAYLTLDELLDLKDEINSVIQELVK